MIVGQLNLINELERKVKNNTLPRFIIFVGPKGSQKLEMAQYITSILYHNKVIVDDISVDNIRNIINLYYKVPLATRRVSTFHKRDVINTYYSILQVSDTTHKTIIQQLYSVVNNFFEIYNFSDLFIKTAYHYSAH